jgi:hypothetical protein
MSMNDHQPVIFHYHIFKNAGSSVNFALKQFFGDRYADFEGIHAHDILLPSSVAQFMRANPEVRAVSSHLARPPVPFDYVKPIVFLRHPLLRAISVYEFTRRDSSQPFFDIVSKKSLAQYLEWALAGSPGGVVVRDYQVIHLSDASFCANGILSAKATEADLNQALNVVSDFPAIGIAESFDRGMRLFETLYEPLFPGLRLRVVHENKTSHSRSISDAEAELPPRILEEFKIQNAYDYRLYAHAHQKFVSQCMNLEISTSPKIEPKRTL